MTEWNRHYNRGNKKNLQGEKWQHVSYEVTSNYKDAVIRVSEWQRSLRGSPCATFQCSPKQSMDMKQFDLPNLKTCGIPCEYPTHNNSSSAMHLNLALVISREVIFMMSVGHANVIPWMLIFPRNSSFWRIAGWRTTLRITAWSDGETGFTPRIHLQALRVRLTAPRNNLPTQRAVYPC